MRQHFLFAIGVILALACSASFARGIACKAPHGMPAARLLLFGELHGATESPALVGRIVCAIAESGPVALGLELPVTEQEPIDRYLASDGAPSAEKRLLSGRFWLGGDGRSSRAMFDLIRYVRKLKQHGLPVAVFTLVPATLGNTADDNQDISRAIRTFHRDHPRMRIVVLMGNLHAGQAKISPFGTMITPAGYLLRDLHPASIQITHPAGTIWACTDSCGTHHVSGRSKSRKSGFYNDAPIQGYSMAYMLPSITASPPAGLAVKQHPAAIDRR